MAHCPTGPQPQIATVDARLDVCILRRHVAGRENVGEEEHLFVAQRIILDLERAHVRVRDAQVFRLAAGVMAGQMRVAKQSRGRVTHRLGRGVGIAIRRVAAGVKDISCDNVPDPTIEDARDVIVRITSTAICGSDLHLFDGYMPAMEDAIFSGTSRWGK